MRSAYFALLAFGCFVPTLAVGAEFYTNGHADLSIGFKDGAFDIHVHAEGATIGGVVYDDEEFEPDDVIIFVSPATLENRSANFLPVLNFDPIGVGEGLPFYKLPSSSSEASSEGVPFLGIGTEEISDGIFVGNRITLAIESVAGPGFFSIFQNAFPGPNFQASSFDGLPDSFSYFTGIHDHFNYGFTAPGIYEVTLRATGNLIGGGTVTGTGTYTFAVGIPEASTTSMLVTASLGLSILCVRSRLRQGSLAEQA
jgi:surface-anchored protein